MGKSTFNIVCAAITLYTFSHSTRAVESLSPQPWSFGTYANMVIAGLKGAFIATTSTHLLLYSIIVFNEWWREKKISGHLYTDILKTPTLRTPLIAVPALLGAGTGLCWGYAHLYEVNYNWIISFLQEAETLSYFAAYQYTPDAPHKEAFLKEIGRHFRDSRWPLVDAFDVINNQFINLQWARNIVEKYPSTPSSHNSKEHAIVVQLAEKWIEMLIDLIEIIKSQPSFDIQYNNKMQVESRKEKYMNWIKMIGGCIG